MFRLLIECSKDIEKISIDFADGSTVVRECQGNSEEAHETTGYPSERPIDISGFSGSSEPVSKEVVNLPDIPADTRVPAVADELHNLDI